MGNPFVASMLYKLVQDDAIISRKEKFGVRDVWHIFKEKMGITANMRNAMLKGVDVELNEYRHLWEAADSMGKMPSQEDNRKSKKDNNDKEYAPE